MFEIVPAIIAGIIATVVMTIVMYVGRAMLPEQMPMNILHMLGTMMLKDSGMVYVMGGAMHLINGIIFAIIHAAIYAAFGIESNLILWGLVLGAVHWAVAGMAMGMMPMMHSGIKDGMIDAPSAFVMSLPMMNRMGFLIVHLIFGLLVGVFYGALVG